MSMCVNVSLTDARRVSVFVMLSGDDRDMEVAETAIRSLLARSAVRRRLAREVHSAGVMRFRFRFDERGRLRGLGKSLISGDRAFDRSASGLVSSLRLPAFGREVEARALVRFGSADDASGIADHIFLEAPVVSPRAGPVEVIPIASEVAPPPCLEFGRSPIGPSARRLPGPTPFIGAGPGVP